MGKFSKIEEIAKANGGYFFARNTESAGITKMALSLYVKQGKLDRVRRGVYLLPDYFEDEMFSIQSTVPLAVYSHDTALYLHDLCDRDPLRYTVTVPFGYNSATLRNKNICVRTDKKETHNSYIVEVCTVYGNKVRVYDIERTICDSLKPRCQVDIALITDAFKRYAKSKHKNLHKLMIYAASVGVDKKVRSYLEVLL
jgi:predicted transcriptional regulator of viral defense system